VSLLQTAMLTKSTGTTNERDVPGSRGNGMNVMNPEPEQGTLSVVGIGFGVSYWVKVAIPPESVATGGIPRYALMCVP